jgi:ATP-dependent DNA helicase RecQ
LAYFGETTSHDCGQCDVCLSSSKNYDALHQQILSILADDKPHHITELARLPYPSQDIDATLALLIREEYVFQQDGYLQRATT